MAIAEGRTGPAFRPCEAAASRLESGRGRMMNTAPFHYFDHNATTPVAPEVVAAMLPLLTEWWGNPSSAYQFAQETSRRVDRAREQVAALLNAQPREIVFTSGGTESINTDSTARCWCSRAGATLSPRRSSIPPASSVARPWSGAVAP